jgi:16S rRNA (adenine1518-N6/adenine1519-N6)-dimethyltransferase
MHTKRELLPLLQLGGIRLTKRLGQHYLVDPNLTRRVVEVCDIAPGQTVIEIGAGLGALTDLLAARAGRVIALEPDRRVGPLLAHRMAALPNVEVVGEDALAWDWSPHAGCAVVGAIPYHITSPILVMLAEHARAITGAWLGMQREVALRLAAMPGTKAYGRLTILIQYHFEVKVLMRLPRQAFFPAPTVDSAWVRLLPRSQPPVEVARPQLFFALVQAAFGQRRKTLLNALTHGMHPALSRPDAEALLAAAGLPPQVRGETLSIAQFATLANLLASA